MALATNSTPGSIVLAGDLTGTANAPQLRITGVVPGSYTSTDVVVDNKGRLVRASNGTFVSPGDATAMAAGIVQLGSGLDTTPGVMSIPDATVGTSGVIQAGSGFTMTGDVLSADVATSSSKGLVQVGSGLQISSNIMSVVDATSSSKGLVQVGSGLLVSGGVVSVDTANPPVATGSSKGVVQVGTGFDVASASISTTIATNSTKGVVQVGTGFSVSSGSVNVNASIIPQKNNSVTWSGGQFTPVKTITSGDYVIDLAASNDFYRAADTAVITLAAPTNATTNVFNVIADCGTDATFVWLNKNNFSLTGGTGGAALAAPTNRYICIDSSSATSTCLSGDIGGGIVSGTYPSSGSWTYLGEANGYIYMKSGLTASAAARSSDGGKTWTAITLSGSSRWTGLAYGAGIYVMLAYTGNNISNYAYSFNGGTTWTEGTFPSADVRSKCYYVASANKFVAFGINGYSYSSNGVSWTDATYPTGFGGGWYLNGALYLPHRGGYSTDISRSTDAINWSTITMPAVGGWSLQSYDSIIIADNSDSGSAAFSYTSNGSSWTNCAGPTTSGSVSHAGSLFFWYTYGGTTMYYSADGSSWSVAATGTAFHREPTYDGLRYFIVDTVSGSSLRIISSNDSFSSTTESTISWSPMSNYRMISNSSNQTSTLVLNSGAIWAAATMTGLPLAFHSSYKFSNNPPNIGVVTINCVADSGATYCTFNK